MLEAGRHNAEGASFAAAKPRDMLRCMLLLLPNAGLTKIVFASMSSVKVAFALLLVTPDVPCGLRTGRRQIRLLG